MSGVERLNTVSDSAIAKAFREHAQNCRTPATDWIERRAEEISQSTPMMDCSTFQEVEAALDSMQVPCTDDAGKWLTLAERIASWNRRTPPPQAAGGEPVAWRHRYLCPEEGPSVWNVSQDESWMRQLMARNDHEVWRLYDHPPAIGQEWDAADVSAAYVSGQSDIRTLVRDLAERWERLAEVHGQRQFTGNDHRLFANELRAVAGLPIAAAPAQQ